MRTVASRAPSRPPSPVLALDHRNRAGVPDRAVLWLGSAAAVLAAAGSLTALVEAASLAFLFTFTVVCGLAFRLRAGVRAITGGGALAAAAAFVALAVRLVRESPWSLLALGLLMAAVAAGRKLLLRSRASGGGGRS